VCANSVGKIMQLERHHISTQTLCYGLSL